MRISAGLVILIRNSVDFLLFFLRKVKVSKSFGIHVNTGMLCCIVKLPDEACLSHTKCVGENNTVFTTQAVHRRAAHWFNFKKI